ncbi:MAG: gamma-glutamylcyclotransferase family protein [Pseudomonadota bacterium]
MHTASEYWYFAYGSNMNPARVRERKLPFDLVCPGRLTGFELSFNKRSGVVPGAGHANILRRAGAVVEGVLYRLPSAASIERMDPFERYPINYTRRLVAIDRPAPSMGREALRALAWTYFATPAASADAEETTLLPETEYLAHLTAGAAFLTPAYVARLRSQPVHTGNRD